MNISSTILQRMLKCLLSLTVVVGLGVSAALAQNRTVTGKITSGEDGTGMPGVNVILKGTQKGTSTNGAGTYSIEVAGNNPVLTFSFVGYAAQEIAVGARSIIDVSLTPSAENLSEVVVTALGIKREEKSLGYSVGKIDSKELNRVAQENVLNAMAGKVAGVTVSSTGGTGSSVSMIIRGATSLGSDNQPLFVVDGVPLANTLNNISQVGNDNRADFGNSISSLNPDDIESVSILKGPSAAALYGSRAGHGVVLITTKNGAKAKRMTVSITSNTVFDKPFKFLKWQTQFGPGQFSAIPPSVSGNPLTNPFGGLIQENVGATYGAALDKGYEEVQWNSPLDANGKPIKMPLVSHPNNVRNFVQTGITTTNGVSVANSNDNYSYRLSYSNMQNRGIIPNSDLFRNTINLNTSVKVSEKLRISTNLDLSRSNSNNRPAGNRGTNPLQWAYAVSPHTDIKALENYWLPGQEGLQQRSQFKGIYNNPYFLAHEVNNSFVRDRVFGNIRADWQISPLFSVMGRYAVDTYNENREMKIANSYTGDPRGAYGLINLGNLETNADFLVTYKKEIKDFTLSLSAGGNSRYQRGSNVTNATKNGTGLIVPGVYTIQNIAPANLDYNSSRFQRAMYSAYGLANFGYRDMIFLDVTARNDWSSTLPAANRSYFYPSASLSLLVNEMIPMSNQISMLKLRTGFAQVGNDANPYQLLGSLGNAGTWDGIPRLSTQGTLLIADLKPEIVTSYESGIDLNLFKNRLRFSGTYYTVENRNQILSTKLPPSSGFSSKNINAGLLVSKGFELSLGGTIVDNNDWRWDLAANWTRNRTTIKSLSDDLPYYTLWQDAKGGAWTYVGEQIGDIYDAKIVTVEDKASPYFGYPILDQTGKWQSIDAINTKNKIGNFNPKFVMGMQTSVSYKGFSLSMSFDWRNGGDFVSQTYRYGEENGQSQLFLDKLINPNGLTGDALRNYLVANQDELIRIHGNYFPLVGGPTPDYGGYPFKYGPYTLPHGGVFIPGVMATGYDANGNPTGYKENLGGTGTAILPFAGSTAWSFTRAFLYDASFLKLREITVGYDIPQKFLKKVGVQSANFSVYSRNIILWTAAKINIDPENAFQPEAGVQGGSQFKQGIERYNVNPWVIPVGFKLGLTF
ncbi:SusC/RagA family TonB-linked outer membrane protein [Runella slithyformis]|uniref:TonB-dependent receptor plug n=1 Tax=Runella slithyformis (strain ATCC 29530 / DSM 19594 / LMG 11500 / NCIMB 11436 / LSU 4) TaxID=761193 RepID=A0A7U4E6C9_RUNSL|nr:SusC/RagA family TonB-linked outer membrane protein [Runella slithyformis]AEI49138.1 TonB-dependent receptor plug [Runella slithyformis DSM 19594]